MAQHKNGQRETIYLHDSSGLEQFLGNFYQHPGHPASYSMEQQKRLDKVDGV
jgi:hypothetical protein